MRAHRIIAPVAAAFLLVGALGAPADANVRKFKDRRGDVRGSIDVTKIRVDNATSMPKRVVVRIKQRRFKPGDEVQIYFDMNAEHRGPEFRLGAYYRSEYGMSRMKSWTKSGRNVRCGYDKFKLKTKGHGVSRASVHRDCLGKPGRIRVAVKTASYQHDRFDWAPAKRTWLGWVKR